MIQEYGLIKVKIADLTFDPENPNELSNEQEAGLRMAFEKFGNVYPILIDQDNFIVHGNHRAKIYESLGEPEIPAFRRYFHDDDERRLCSQTMNKLHGQYETKKDADQLLALFQNNHLEELADLIATPKDDLLRAIQKGHPEMEFHYDDDFDLKNTLEEITPTTQLGDVWQLDEHRLICADCTDSRSIDRLLDGQKPQLVFLDPPYNIGFNYRDANDKKDLTEYSEFISNVLNTVAKVCNKMIATPGPRNIGLWESKLRPDDLGTWYESNSHSGASAFHFRTCEPILFYGKTQNKRTTDFFAFPSDIGKQLRSVENDVGVTENHAPSKPLGLMFELFRTYTKQDDIILDTFLGSGSSLVACEQAHRRCYGVELDPIYCDVIVKRWEKLTGKKANLLK